MAGVKLRSTTALSYARHSTDMQRPTSISAQHRKANEYAEGNSWRVVEEISDAAVTARTDRRKGFETLEERIRARAVDVILIESLDRLSRHDVDLPRIYRRADFNGVELHTLDKGRVTRLDVGVAGLLNPIQTDQIVYRTHRSLEEQVIKEGKSAGGLSYGYRIPVDDKGLRMTGELVIDDAQAAIVLRIFREYAEGRTPREIAHRLNKDGISCPASGKREGTPAWNQSTIQGNRERGTGILNNDLYRGLRVWNRLKYRLHLDTRKRVSRLRDPSEHRMAEVPQLRIVPDELW
jgi:DNA invertase Pin-like site-specific DNA recombinase